MDLPWDEEPPRPCLRAGRVAGAGVAGAALGALVAAIWHGAATAASNACRPPVQGGSAGFCIPAGQAAEGIIISFFAICLGVLGAFALLRVRPRRLTIPVGCVVVAWTVLFTSTGFAGGHGPAPWAAGIAAGAGLAAVALTVDWGRAQKAGLIALAIILLASLVVPRVIAQHGQAGASARKVTAVRASRTGSWRSARSAG
ncbi:MAG TPA: hypothetical protein VMU95_23230 [Trebonia sp.]|nr:hypothetical protein [Trebonia sp.]